MATRTRSALRDITADTVEQQRPRRRRAKAPLHPKRPFASSLPPSSPPSSSSQLPPEEDSAALDDPFGFLAVEQKLKARRDQEPPRARTTVPIQSLESTPNPLLTPKKRTRKRKTLPSLSDSFSSNTSSVPSTPSPVKTISGVVVPKPEVGDKKEKTRKAKGTKKARKTDDMNPEELASHLEALLPKRPVKAQVVASKKKGKGRKKTVIVEFSDEEKEVKQEKRRKAKAKVESEDEEEDDKLAQERQARLEYFKKLDGYVVQKEDVWIV